MPDSVRGFDIERSENNVDLQEKKPGLDNLQAAADAALNGRAERGPSTLSALACIGAGGSRHGLPAGRMSAARESRVGDVILHVRHPFGIHELQSHSSDA
ncbi:MAG: hypothetical protein ACXU87_10740 [Xanthobacteraceae bacterium]